MSPEGRIQKKIMEYLKENNIYSFKTMVSNSMGVPDIIACHNGLFIGIEVKAQKGVVSPMQEHHIKKIKESGGVAIVARSVEDVKKFIV